MIGVGGICVCLKASLQGFAHQQLITESGEASIGVSRLQQPAWGGGAGVFMGQPGHIFPAGGAWIIPPLETQPAFDGNQEVLCLNVIIWLFHSRLGSG